MLKRTFFVLLLSFCTSLSYGQDSVYKEFNSLKDSLFKLQGEHRKSFYLFKKSDPVKSDYHSAQANLCLNKISDLILDYTDKYADSEVSKTILEEYFFLLEVNYNAISRLMGILNKHENFDKDLKAKAQHSFNVLNEKRMVGQIAPDFKLSDTTGKEISLSDYKGKIVWLNFWASW